LRYPNRWTEFTTLSRRPACDTASSHRQKVCVEPNMSVEPNLRDTVLQHMRTNPARLNIDQTVGQALETIRQSPPPARIVYFYVVDSDGRLQGVIPTRGLLLSPPEMHIRDIMLPKVVAIPASATVLEACEFFVFHRFLAFPIVDPQRHLVGSIDVELYTDELRDLGGGLDDSLFQLIGVHLARAKRIGVFSSFHNRFTWLLCNLVGGVICAFLCGFFEADLKNAVALALFIPVVLSLGESVSIQSLSLSLQRLHGKPPSWLAIGRRIWTESLVGLLLGTASGLLVGAIALLWIGKLSMVGCILGGIVAGVTCAAVTGVLVPNLLHRLKLDPRVAAGPIALAVADIITLLCYFELARMLLS
jgi:magnesium transporter